jgi:hypothetical protein
VKRRNYSRQWDAFRKRRGDLFALLLCWARRELAKGEKRISVKALWERLRATRMEKRLNNSLTPYAARALVAEEPRLRGVIELRRAA